MSDPFNCDNCDKPMAVVENDIQLFRKNGRYQLIMVNMQSSIKIVPSCPMPIKVETGTAVGKMVPAILCMQCRKQLLKDFISLME